MCSFSCLFSSINQSWGLFQPDFYHSSSTNDLSELTSCPLNEVSISSDSPRILKTPCSSLVVHVHQNFQSPRSFVDVIHDSNVVGYHHSLSYNFQYFFNKFSSPAIQTTFISSKSSFFICDEKDMCLLNRLPSQSFANTLKSHLNLEVIHNV